MPREFVGEARGAQEQEEHRRVAADDVEAQRGRAVPGRRRAERPGGNWDISWALGSGSSSSSVASRASARVAQSLLRYAQLL